MEKKVWYKSKTVLFNIVLVGGAVASGLVGLLPTLSFLFSPETYAIVFAIVGLINIGLRTVTSNAIKFFPDSTE